MHEARVFPDMLRQIGQKSDDVMVGFPLDLVDACDLEFAFFPYLLRGLLGDQTQGSLGITGMCLDLEPDPEFVLGRPDFGHLRTAVTRNHALHSKSRGNSQNAVLAG